MASYEYSCSKCDIKTIKYRGISDPDPGYKCDTCNLKLTRVYSSSIGVMFNGSGFYSTDK